MLVARGAREAGVQVVACAHVGETDPEIESVVVSMDGVLEAAAIGKIIGPAFSYDEVVDAIENIIATYLDLREDGETFNDSLARLGPRPFKERLYGAH